MDSNIRDVDDYNVRQLADELRKQPALEPIVVKALEMGIGRARVLQSLAFQQAHEVTCYRLVNGRLQKFSKFVL